MNGASCGKVNEILRELGLEEDEDARRVLNMIEAYPAQAPYGGAVHCCCAPSYPRRQSSCTVGHASDFGFPPGVSSRARDP